MSKIISRESGLTELLCPRPGDIKRWCCLTSVCLMFDICRVHPVGGQRIGWSGPARPAWLKAAAARFRCRPGRGHIVAAARLQLVKKIKRVQFFCPTGYVYLRQGGYVFIGVNLFVSCIMRKPLEHSVLVLSCACLLLQVYLLYCSSVRSSYSRARWQQCYYRWEILRLYFKLVCYATVYCEI